MERPLPRPNAPPGGIWAHGDSFVAGKLYSCHSTSMPWPGAVTNSSIQHKDSFRDASNRVTLCLVRNSIHRHLVEHALMSLFALPLSDFGNLPYPSDLITARRVALVTQENPESVRSRISERICQKAGAMDAQRFLVADALEKGLIVLTPTELSSEIFDLDGVVVDDAELPQDREIAAAFATRQRLQVVIFKLTDMQQLPPSGVLNINSILLLFGPTVTFFLVALGPHLAAGVCVLLGKPSKTQILIEGQFLLPVVDRSRESRASRRRTKFDLEVVCGFTATLGLRVVGMVSRTDGGQRSASNVMLMTTLRLEN